MGGVLVIIWIIICALVYIPIGIILLTRSNRKAIRNRSPLLVSIGHWSNFLESLFLLLSLFIYFSKSSQNYYFDVFYQLIVILIHYSYYISYMLRCYRVYFIFNLDSRWDENDCFFKANLHRAGQKWLFKVFLICLWPVIIIATFRIAIPGAYEYLPPSYYEGQTSVSSVSEGIYLLIMFLEELGFILAVYMLRNVHDDFKMTRELAIVCFLWVITGIFSIFTETWIWRVEVVIRNHVIMGVSSIFPLFKTMQPESFDEIITMEMLQSLELVLQSSITLEAFEKALNNIRGIKYANGNEFLQLWLKCEYFRHSKIEELEKDIIDTAKALGCHGKHPNTIQSEVFQIINNKFFPMFRKSSEYEALLREITKQQIYMHRIMQTSLIGDSEIHISNVI